MKILSRSEEIVLLAVWKLQDAAYGVEIRKQVSRATGHDWSIGAIYAPLHRLEKKKLVRSFMGEPVAERGGRSKVYYTVTPEGKNALIETRQIHETIWRDIPDLGIS